MNINLDLFYFINHNLQNPLLDSVMPVLTQFGDFIFLFFILLIVILYAHLKRNHVLKRIGFLVLMAFLFSGIIAIILKHMIHEPRPFISLSNVHLLIAEDDPLSFPSGHTTSIMAIVSVLILNMKELSKKYYKIIDLVLIIFAIIMPFSRIYVGVHYPCDILAGAIIGICGGFLVNYFFNTKKLNLRWFK